MILFEMILFEMILFEMILFKIDLKKSFYKCGLTWQMPWHVCLCVVMQQHVHMSHGARVARIWLAPLVISSLNEP